MCLFSGRRLAAGVLLVLLVLSGHRPARAAPTQLQLQPSTPTVPNGSPFGITVTIQGEQPTAPLVVTPPEGMQWRVIPAGCTGSTTITCADLAPPWAGTFEGAIWSTPGEVLSFHAQLGDQTALGRIEVTSWIPPPTPVPPATATPSPTPTATPTSTPTAMPTATPPVPTAIPTLAPPPADPSDPVGAPAGQAAPPVVPTDPPVTPTPAALRGVVIVEQPRAAPAATAVPLQSVTLPLLACYDRNGSQSCDPDDGVRGLTAYVTNAQTGQLLAQGLTDDAGQAVLSVRVAPETALLVSVPSFAWTQRTMASRPFIPPLLVLTVAPLPALIP